MAICPAGHTSTQTDFCDTCGRPIDPAQADSQTVAEQSVEASAPAALTCPNCEAANVAEALFCEACGYDFTTGSMPETPAPAAVVEPAAEPSPPRPPVEWVAELWIDPDWYATQGSTDPLPSPGLPDIAPLVKPENLIGRVSNSRGIFPDVDCELDTGCSRRHALLSTDGTRWWIEDLGSANGTFVGSATGPLPAMPIPSGRVELAPDQRIYLGAWTRIVVRRATDDEKEAFGG